MVISLFRKVVFGLRSVIKVLLFGVMVFRGMIMFIM